MKKTISLVLMIAMLFSVSAFAEEFTLHNGTKFGMSMQDVADAELSKGFSVSPEGDGLYGEGTIAGRSPSAVRYFFDENEKLVHCDYFIYLNQQNSSNNGDYTSTNESLISKYGTPVATEETGTPLAVYSDLSPSVKGLFKMDDTGYPVTGESISGEIYTVPIGDDGKNAKLVMYECPRYSQWLIEQADGTAILIDHCYIIERYHFSINGELAPGDDYLSYYEMINYTLLSAEEVESLNESTDKAMDDL